MTKLVEEFLDDEHIIVVADPYNDHNGTKLWAGTISVKDLSNTTDTENGCYECHHEMMMMMMIVLIYGERYDQDRLGRRI